ncbi:zinc ribbon domain-containing protein [Caballeronia sp. Lep1P3]|uniref:zinc ribbon domain-containing protein n=1 Tax=Caballeronia sp. Lep1P3 TaxID=2878150 RepID=UPI001FD1C155|nr:zinc ribbon domain-containing protein [Caballeronia sp. Lep1P3]
MTTRLTFPASMFSVVCQRCGSTVRKNADSCPNCGADRSATFGKKSAGSDASPAEPLGSMFEQQSSAPLASASLSGPAPEREEPGMRSGWPGGWDPKRASERIAQKAAEHRARRIEQSARDAYAYPSNDPDAVPGSARWNHRKTIIALACALALAAGAAVYLQHGTDDDAADVGPSADLSASGAIDAKLGALGRGATDTADTSAQNKPADKTQPPAPALALAPGDALQGMRVALDRHDLTLARTRMKALGAQDQTRPEFDAMKDELVKRELQRDAALQLARACERTSAWACVQQNAAEALALDGSNPESQAMLEQVISHAGWLVATPQGVKKGASPAGNATNDANTADSATSVSGNVTVPDTPAPPPAAAAVAPAPAPAQANVASPGSTTVPPTTAAASRSASDRRAAQRTAPAVAAAAAARQAALEQAREQPEYLSRAEKIARAQAATNAVVAATTLQPTPTPTPTPTPLAPTPATPPAVAAAKPAAAAPAAPEAKPSTAPAATASQATHNAGSANGMYVGPGAPNSNGMYVAPSGAQNDMYVAPAAPNGMYVAPAARPASPSAAPAALPQRTAPAGAQSSAAPAPTPPTVTQLAPAQTVATQPAAPHTLPSAVPSATPPARGAAIAQPIATVATTAPAASPTARASTMFAASNVTARMDTDKSDDVERAIKQYGWSSGEPAAKPAR